MTTTPVPETLAALRHATSASHDAIDHQLRLDADMSLARYVGILAGFEAYLAAWEPHLAAALPAARREGFAARSRLAMVRDDLRHLGGERAPLAPPVLPALPTPAAAMGSLYVLEGSALGGQLIARRVAERFGFDATNGAAYFTGFGPRTGALWREFREQLEVDVGPDGRDDACRAAVATFDSLGRHFQQVLRDDQTAAA